MRIFRRIKKRSNEAHFLVLDIGSDYVKAVVCEAEGKKVKILGVAKKRQKTGDMQSGVVTDIASVIRNCHIAIRDAENRCGVSPKKMILGISGELVKGSTNTTSYIRRDANKKIDLAELKNIVHKIQYRAFDKVRGELAEETGFNEIDVKLINAAIVDVRIDSYNVKNPIGFQGKEVTVSIFNAFAPLVHYGALQTIASEIDKELLAIAAEPYALGMCMIGDNANFSGIHIDIGAGTTDVAVVRNGTVEGTKMFNLGGRTFTKRLSQVLNISYKEAEEIKVAYGENKLERQSNKIVRQAMKMDSDVWLSGIALTLEEFDNIDVLPSKILISGGGAHLPEIKEALESREWSKYLPFAKKPQIKFMDPRMISDVYDDNNLLKDQQDVVPVALASLALNFISDEQVLSSVLKKVVRLMQM